MANRTAWVAGLGVGLSWTAAFASGDLTSLPSLSSVFSSATPIANGASLDTYADISVEITIGSATPAAGSFIGVFIARLLDNGTTYGDGSYVLGTQKALQPPWSAVGIIQLQSTNATTLLAGSVQGIILPPDTFVFGLYNGTGITFSGTAANNVCKYKTYNLNLNS
jgi:hypothetical protein